MEQYYVAYDDSEFNDTIDFPDGTGPTCGPGETIIITLTPQLFTPGAPIPVSVLLTLEVFGINGNIDEIQAKAIPREEVQSR